LPALIVILLAFAVNVQPASAKGEIRASLDQPLPTDVAPGTTIPVAWKLEVRDEQTDKFVPFGAGPVFVRLIGDNPMQATQAVVDSRRGGYSAKVTVPPGGIKNVQIGFQALPASPRRHCSARILHSHCRPETRIPSTRCRGQWSFKRVVRFDCRDWHDRDRTDDIPKAETRSRDANPRLSSERLRRIVASGTVSN
jgi:hypothetical protein